jgi:hypothetical protein
MRRFLAATAVVMLLADVSVPVLEACGAKFLVATRSARNQRRQRAARPANILVYQHNNDAGVVEFMGALRGALQDVGHKVTLVASEADLREAAETQKFNIVMLQLDEARRLRETVKSWSPGTAILPMGTFVTRPDAARAKEEFGQMLALPAKTSRLFSVVEDAYR